MSESTSLIQVFGIREPGPSPNIKFSSVLQNDAAQEAQRAQVGDALMQPPPYTLSLHGSPCVSCLPPGRDQGVATGQGGGGALPGGGGGSILLLYNTLP